MGLFDFLTDLVTLPIKVAAVPVRLTEKVLGDDDGVITTPVKNLLKVVKETSEEIEGEDE